MATKTIYKYRNPRRGPNVLMMAVVCFVIFVVLLIIAAASGML